MGFWISLEKNNQVVSVDSHTEGGTYVLGGTTDADMSVTYNYSRFWIDALGPIPEGSYEDLYGLGPWIHGKTAQMTLPLLNAGCKRLVGEPSYDYWDACPGNARQVLEILVKWGIQHPDAVWNVHGG